MSFWLFLCPPFCQQIHHLHPSAHFYGIYRRFSKKWFKKIKNRSRLTVVCQKIFFHFIPLFSLGKWHQLWRPYTSMTLDSQNFFFFLFAMCAHFYFNLCRPQWTHKYQKARYYSAICCAKANVLKLCWSGPFLSFFFFLMTIYWESGPGSGCPGVTLLLLSGWLLWRRSWGRQSKSQT